MAPPGATTCPWCNHAVSGRIVAHIRRNHQEADGTVACRAVVDPRCGTAVAPNRIDALLDHWASKHDYYLPNDPLETAADAKHLARKSKRHLRARIRAEFAQREDVKMRLQRQHTELVMLKPGYTRGHAETVRQVLDAQRLDEELLKAQLVIRLMNIRKWMAYWMEWLGRLEEQVKELRAEQAAEQQAADQQAAGDEMEE